VPAVCMVWLYGGLIAPCCLSAGNKRTAGPPGQSGFLSATPSSRAFVSQRPPSGPDNNAEDHVHKPSADESAGAGGRPVVYEALFYGFISISA